MPATHDRASQRADQRTCPPIGICVKSRSALLAVRTQVERALTPDERAPILQIIPLAGVRSLGNTRLVLWFCYHRDRPGSTPLRTQMVEQHWSYMDQFAATMIARGPTFTNDGTLTGSVHILDLPSPTAARDFAFEEPGYQAGAYRDVLLRRWRNSLGRTMWDFRGGRPDFNRYLVLGFALADAADATELPHLDELIASGPLLSDDGSMVLGAAVLLEAPNADRAGEVLSADRYTGIEVHQWRFGGRPDRDGDAG
jgi:uncharacterized protein YciI